MRPLPYLLLLVLLSACATSQPSFYRAPRRARHYYEKHQRQHEHERNRFHADYPDLGW